MGKELLAPAWDNPKGFFENKRVMIFNDSKLLPALKTTWHDLSPLKWDFSLFSDELKKEALQILEEDYGEKPLFGIKDPRMCLLLPFWEKILSHLKSKVKVIIPYRNPLEVAYSLFHRNNFPIGKGLLLWGKYVLYGEYYSREFQRVFVSYDQLVRDPLGTLSLIDEKLELGLSEEIKRNEQGIISFIERNMKKFNLTLRDLPSNTPHFVREAASLLEKLSLGEERDSGNVREKFDRLRESYEREVGNYYIELINHEGSRLQVTLLIDDGKGFRRELSFSKSLKPIRTSQEVSFELPPNLEIYGLRFELPNMPCSCQVERASLFYNGREVKLNHIPENPILTSGERAFFLGSPQILLKPRENPAHSDLLKITFKLSSIGGEALGEILRSLQGEREKLLNEISSIHLSKFWQLTRPLRLVFKGKFKDLLSLIRMKLSKEYRVIKRSGFFDEAWYLKQYEDVRRADVDPIEHYVLHGWKEGRDPAPWFSTSFYLQSNPDVAQAGVNPFYHWIKWGRGEGRKPNPNWQEG